MAGHLIALIPTDLELDASTRSPKLLLAGASPSLVARQFVWFVRCGQLRLGAVHLDASDLRVAQLVPDMASCTLLAGDAGFLAG